MSSLSLTSYVILHKLSYLTFFYKVGIIKILLLFEEVGEECALLLSFIS